MLRKLFVDHPNEVGETYGQHFQTAASFGIPMILGGLACLVHGLVPGLFKSTGSATIRRLSNRLGACPHRAKAYHSHPTSIPAE